MKRRIFLKTTALAAAAGVALLSAAHAENAKLKRMYAELALENIAIKDVLSRKL